MPAHGLSRNLEKYKEHHATRDRLLFMLGGKSFRETAIKDHDNRIILFYAYLEEIFSLPDNKGSLDNAIVVVYFDRSNTMDECGTYGHYQTLNQKEVHLSIVF